MKKRNIRLHLLTFTVLILFFLIVGLVINEVANPECDKKIKLKNGGTVSCNRITYGDNTIHFRTCEGTRKVMPINDIIEIIYVD